MDNEKGFDFEYIDVEAGYNMEEELDSPKISEEIIDQNDKEEPRSVHIAADLSKTFNSHHGSCEAKITVDKVEDDENSNEVPADKYDEISIALSAAEVQDDDDEGSVEDQQSQQHVPAVLSNINNTLRWTSSLTYLLLNHLPRRQQPRPRPWSISKVPSHFREVDHMAYTPKFVSIGPIHRKNMSLLPMEEEKHRFLECLLNEKNQEYPNTLEILKRAMRKIEAKVRRCYSTTFQDVSSNDFVNMLVTDGCFIVRLLCLNHEWQEEGDVSDPIISTRWMLPNIGRDLLMIENQLPLFVLEKIFSITKLTPEASLKELALEFIKSFHIGKEEIVIKKHHTRGHHKHLLDLFHSLYVPSNSSRSTAVLGEKRRNKKSVKAPNVQGKNWVLSATALQSSGVSFYAKAGNNPLEVQFSNGRLRIPSICIDEGSIIILKNLLAYEQSSRNTIPCFTSLVLFFSSLASVPEDVKLLREAAIILHQPGDDRKLIEVLKLLSKQLECDFKDYSMQKQVEDIRAYCASKSVKFWNTIGRTVRQNAVHLILFYLSLVVTYFVHRINVGV